MIHSAIYREAESIAANKSGFDGRYYFKDMYKGISELVSSADVAFVNHEAPITNTAISGYPNFNAPSESGDDLVDLGFNVINIANNHMFDVDNKTTGYADTIAYWDTKDVLQIGGYKNEEDYDNIRILESQGIKMAFLAYTYDPYSSNRMSMNKTSEEEGYILPLIDDDTIIKHIAAAKQKADLVFVSVHWGTENVFKPIYEQERIAQLIADNGADAIFGHHSHTLQPVEWLTGVNGNKTLCALAQWPEWDDAKTVDSTVEIAVQVSGKLKFTKEIPADTSKDDAIALVKADERMAQYLEGKTIVKEISVPGKIVNIVVR